MSRARAESSTSISMPERHLPATSCGRSRPMPASAPPSSSPVESDPRGSARSELPRADLPALLTPAVTSGAVAEYQVLEQLPPIPGAEVFLARGAQADGPVMLRV